MTTDKIRSTVFNEVSLVIAIAGVVIGVVSWVQDPQYKISTRVEQAYAEVDTRISVLDEKVARLHDLEDKMEKLSECLTETNKNLTELRTIIQERLPK